MKSVTSLKATYCGGDRPLITVKLDLEQIHEPRLAVIGETTCVVQGIGDGVRAREVARTFTRLFEGLAKERWPDQKGSIAVIAKGCALYAEEAIEAHAPDRTLEVRAGCLLPMNRLPRAGDQDTITLSAEFAER
jgi:hypothetical protein